MKISFVPFSKSFIEKLNFWLKQPHVAKFWQESKDLSLLTQKYLYELPARGINCFIVNYEDANIGFAQYYQASKVGNGWWEHEPSCTFGMDLFIGEQTHVGKGLGAKIIEQLSSFMAEQEAELKTIIADPEPHNVKSIKAFTKAGFSSEGEIATPNGAAILLRLKI